MREGTKILIAVCLGFALGMSPLRDSAIFKFLIDITGGE